MSNQSIVPNQPLRKERFEDLAKTAQQDIGISDESRLTIFVYKGGMEITGQDVSHALRYGWLVLPKLFQIILLSIVISIALALHAADVHADDNPNFSKIDLTAEELNWIANHKTVTAAVKTGWMPIEYNIESEPSHGISVDYLKEIAALTGLNFKIIEYDQVIDPTKVQLVTGVVGRSELNYYNKIYPAHLYIPYAIYINKHVKNDYRSVNLDDLSSAKIAIYKHAPFEKELKKQYPRMQIINVAIADEAFEYLKNNTIDAYIGNEFVIDYHVEFHRLDYVKKSSTTRFESSVSMAVRNDEVILYSIISKSLAVIGHNNPKIVDYWKTPISPTNTIYKILLALVLMAFLASIYKLLCMRKKSKLEAFKNQRMIWNQANFDRQTKLPNRNFFERKIKKLIQNAEAQRTKFAILYIDLDDFKYVNDISGHSVGDQLLSEASKRICKCVDKSDFTARIGGDEFVIIVPIIQNVSFINGLCQTILNALRQPFSINDHDYYISASIGVSLFPKDTQTYEELMSYADQAMYQAKKLGRDRYVYFTEELQSKINEKITIANHLRQALASNQFELVYQPIVDLNTLEVVKAEALIRWNHPELGLIRPDQFISIAEESGLIHPLGKWILKQAIQDLKYLHQHFGDGFNLAINISPMQFTQPRDLIDFLLALDSNRIPPNVICFEITEGLLLAPSEMVINTIKFLKGKGVKFSIDDFGTGYSALAYLRNFDIDFLKIDKAFTRDVDSDIYNNSLCQFIILMAHNLNIQVIAEGVEHQIQENILGDLGCDFVQGYLHGKPMSKQELVKLKSSLLKLVANA